MVFHLVPWQHYKTNPFGFFLLQPGTFDLVGTIVYEIDNLPYQNTFYNGTIEVTEAGGLISVETVFLVSLGLALLVLLGLWVRGQIQNLSKVLTCTLSSQEFNQSYLHLHFFYKFNEYSCKITSYK